jgi:F-type H+-transporting ATPase subunit delta
MRPSTTALRYAEAAYDVAREERSVDAWRRDLDAAVRAVTSPEALKLFREPTIERSKKLGAIETVLANAQPGVLNLLRLLVLRERVALLPQIRDEFVRLDRETRGVVEAEVTVAREYDQSEREDIRQGLAAATGKQVELRFSVDPRILGGIVVRIGDRLIDGSVSGRLQRLRHEMAV